MKAVNSNDPIIRLWIGKQVKVRLKSGKTITGLLMGVISAVIVLKHGGKRVRYDMFDIAELSTL